ncbi:hypothetical protein OH77DRAFT_1519049 [Trametes cingulata]|nr:hypothetical protein OH77DRAFT_1519049 [Trametes cingulata]
MPKEPVAGPSSSKQVQQLENKVNKLRWINNDLNKQVFEAVQRGHRLAAKLGYQNLEDAEVALATQTADDAQSQLEQLSQQPTEELASHVQDLQSELLSHVQLSKSTLSALGDALREMTELREENLALRSELERLSAKKMSDISSKTSADATEAAFLREELDSLRKQYADLQRAKEDNDRKHAEDFQRWRRFKEWLFGEEEKEKERASKRRKLNPKEDEEGKENAGGRDVSPDRLSESECMKRFGRIRERFLRKGPRGRSTTPARATSSGMCFVYRISLDHLRPSEAAAKAAQKKPAALSSRNLNSSSSEPSSPVSAASTPKAAALALGTEVPLKPPPGVPFPRDDVAFSSETEPESQPVTFLFPSQIDVTARSSTIPQKRPRSPVQHPDSSETELESQAPTFLYPSQIIPEPSARTTDMTPKPQPAHIRTAQLWTPVSAARPQQALKAKANARSSPEAVDSSSASSSAADPFRAAPVAALPGAKTRLPDTPVSLGPRKGKERLAQNNENAAPSTSDGKKYPADYSAFKGRGRYKPQLQAGKETINAQFALDPARNEGVGFQYEEVVRDKRKRKHMHAGDCECCRDYYEAVGPLPPRPQGPLWRSPESTPSKPPRGDSFGSAAEDAAAAAIQEHKQAVSRHRQHWDRAKTPPRYWNIGFPDTQEVAAMNAEAARMHEQKRAMVAEEAKRGGRFKRR